MPVIITVHINMHILGLFDNPIRSRKVSCSVSLRGAISSSVSMSMAVCNDVPDSVDSSSVPYKCKDNVIRKGKK